MVKNMAKGTKEVHIFRCEVCGNMVMMIEESGAPMTCCGRTMKEVTANSTDGDTEKHVPQIAIEGDRVCVRIGSEPHPMEEMHYIQWISLETDRGMYRRDLKAGEPPVACFELMPGEKVLGAYEFCNVHGLWTNHKDGETAKSDDLSKEGENHDK